jgi:serpin B
MPASRSWLASFGLGLLGLFGCTPTTPSGTASGGSGGAGGESGRGVPLETAVASTNRFTTELYRTIADPHTNGAASPYTVAVAFGMTREGARGATREELDQSLHLEGDASAAFGALADRIASIGSSGVELRTANRVFLDEAQSVEAPFESAMRDGFRAPLERVSFQSDAEGARTRINGWVAGQTNDRIEELLPAGAVDANTRLVLTNAVYFHGGRPPSTAPAPKTCRSSSTARRRPAFR